LGSRIAHSQSSFLVINLQFSGHRLYYGEGSDPERGEWYFRPDAIYPELRILRGFALVWDMSINWMILTIPVLP
jgi:hypothetical protein